LDSVPEPVVFIVDDDEAVRTFIRRLIDSVGLKYADYANAVDFLDDGRFENQPGCLVLDIRMPDMSGLELQQELRRRRVELPIIILTGHGNVQVAVHTMKAGAIDFIEKPFNNEMLLARVQRAVGWSVAYFRDNKDRKEIIRRLDSLSTRERQVFELVVEGLTNRAIAERLNVSDKTVEHHRARMMGKMQAESLPELIRMAARSAEEVP
jgi:RNA polymerase sigma factor (sigma-70 family)